MSAFVRIDKFGADSRILRLRGLANMVGEDARGVITSEAVKVPYFSLLAIGRRYLLKLHRAALGQIGKSAGKSIPSDSQTWLNGEAYFGIGDYTFFITPASNDAEALAQSDCDAQALLDKATSDQLPQLSFNLAGLGKSYFLFEKVEFSLGSDAECTIQIDIGGVANKHLIFKYDTHTLHCQALHPVSVDAAEYCGAAFTITSDETIKLLPSGIQITITFPRPR